MTHYQYDRDCIRWESNHQTVELKSGVSFFQIESMTTVATVILVERSKAVKIEFTAFHRYIMENPIEDYKFEIFAS